VQWSSCIAALGAYVGVVTGGSCAYVSRVMNQVKQDMTVILRGGGVFRCVYIIIVVAAIEVDDSECTGLCHSSLLDIKIYVV
jgi:hypothetical protein